jgi:hypothetical protein
LNEMADEAAGHARLGPPDEVDTRYTDYDFRKDGITFSWRADPADEEEISTKDPKLVIKRWTAQAVQLQIKAVQNADTFGGRFLTREDAGRHLLALSRAIRPWSAQEERHWMQQVGRVLPLNGYLHRIGKHATGDCPWHPGIRETQMHFQCDCKKFEPHRTTAHHDIAKAVISALKERTKGWKFYYETQFQALPFHFKWTDRLQAWRQRRRRPDGVAWHEQDKVLLFLEFSRPMDQDENIRASTLQKGTQYDEAVNAILKGQRSQEGQLQPIKVVRTVPLIFGVRGSVDLQDITSQLAPFKMKKPARVIAAGIRAAISGASNMIVARREALSELQGEQRERRQIWRAQQPQAQRGKERRSSRRAQRQPT